MTPHFLLIDLFCGAGGTTIGAESSGVCKVIAAINHDPVAILSHSANHPEVDHFTEDVRTLNLDRLRDIARRARGRYPAAKLILWASPDCTHFSRAKSGPKNRDSRTLADELPRYVAALDPDYLLVENVEEFTSWGPLDDAGRPLSRYEGRDYMAWVHSLTALGYYYDYRVLNAADYGAFTSRRRYFGQFSRLGLPQAWPESTHAKAPVREGLFSDHRQPWQPVYRALELNDIGRSIFDRERPLVDKTLRRILNGLRKFMDKPMLMTYNSPGYCLPVDRPSGALTTAGVKGLVTPMLIKYYGTGSAVSIEESSPTVTTKDRMALATPVQWIDQNFSSAVSGASIENPLGSITTNPKAAICTAWLVNPQFKNKGNSITEPSPTVIARQQSYPLSLAVAIQGPPRWLPAEGDSAVMLELKAFMQANQVADIFLRMLHERELARIQGFPEHYVLHGTAAHRKKQIGNAVVSHIPEHWLQSLAKKQTAAPTVHHQLCAVQ